MEQAPDHIVDQVRTALLEFAHVAGVHDLHVWTITSALVALSAHVTCPGSEHHEELLRSAQDMLAKTFRYPAHDNPDRRRAVPRGNRPPRRLNWPIYVTPPKT